MGLRAERRPGERLPLRDFPGPSAGSGISWPELEAILEKRGGKRWAFTVWLQPFG
jgi:hypothetical protein